MSMYVSLNIDDYKRLTAWFELAFAKADNTQSEQDDYTLKKISAMSLGHQEDMELFRK